jgi:membrane fusion protein (multidrug efflux system)
MLRDEDRTLPDAAASGADRVQGGEGMPAPRTAEFESALLSDAAEAAPKGDAAPTPEARKPEEEKPHRSKDDGDEEKTSKSKDETEDGKNDDGDDDESDGEKKPGFVKRHPFVVAGIVLGLIVAGVTFYFYWLTALHPFESTDDAFVDAREFAISPKVAGYIASVPVTDNQFVGAGSPIVQIDDRDYRIALEQAEAQVSGAQATLEGFASQIAAQQAQVEEAKSQVVQAEAQVKFAEQDAARYQDLAARGAGTVQQAQQSTSNLQQQQANLARAQAAVTAAQKQITSIQSQQANGTANLGLARAQLDQARLNLTYTTVVAAQAGRVVRLSAAKGAFAQSGQNLSMFVPSDMWITANYKETQITDMRPGQPVDIEVDAYPGRKLRGHVDSVQPGSGTAFSLLPAENATGNYVKVVQRVPVKIVFDDLPTDIVIGPGMSVVPRARVR